MALVLVVDDDAGLRAAARHMLEPAGFEVEEAADGQQAVRALRRRPADLVLCDLFMPDADGIELLRHLPAEFAGVRVLAMSGGGCGGKVDLLPVARRLGAAEVLYKPFDQAAVVAAVGRALRAPPGSRA